MPSEMVIPDGPLLELASLMLDFGRVHRATYHQDGVTRESDTDHTVMLTVIACAIAAEFHPSLDQGLIAQFCTVHDLVEAPPGARDIATLRLPTAKLLAEKKRMEREAFEWIAARFGDVFPWLHRRMAEYEALSTREARFVKAVDKVVPKLTHILNRGATIREEGMTPDELAARYTVQDEEMQAYAADFPELFQLRGVLLARLLEVLDGPGPHPPQADVCLADLSTSQVSEIAAAAAASVLDRSEEPDATTAAAAVAGAIAVFAAALNSSIGRRAALVDVTYTLRQQNTHLLDTLTQVRDLAQQPHDLRTATEALRVIRETTAAELAMTTPAPV